MKEIGKTEKKKEKEIKKEEKVVGKPNWPEPDLAHGPTCLFPEGVRRPLPPASDERGPLVRVTPYLGQEPSPCAGAPCTVDLAQGQNPSPSRTSPSAINSPTTPPSPPFPFSRETPPKRRDCSPDHRSSASSSDRIPPPLVSPRLPPLLYPFHLHQAPLPDFFPSVFWQ
jgi:hypothetical protein